MAVIAITGTTSSGVRAPEAANHGPSPDQLDAAVVVFTVGSRSLGLFASRVDEVQPAAEVMGLPEAPPAVEGVLDLHGEIVPVLDGRRLLQLPPRPTLLTDLFVIVRSGARAVLHVDAAVGLVDLSLGEIAAVAPLAPRALRAAGIARMDDGLLVVHDTDTFLSSGQLAQAG